MARQSRETAPPQILLTRPAAQAARFAQELRQRIGPAIPILTSPLLAPEFLSPALPARPVAVIFTSETGVAAFRRLWGGKPLPAFCVGDRTAAAARGAGFDAASAAGDAAALVELIAAARPSGPLLHARGEQSAGEVARRLADRGFAVTEAVVYRQRAQPLNDVARAALRGAGPVILPLFSPRSARILLSQGPFRARLWLAALSPAVAEAAAPAQPERVEVAAEPQALAMVEAVARLIDAASQP